MKQLAILASGNGSNFEAIAKHKNAVYEVRLLISDHENAFVLERAKLLNIPCFVFERKDFMDKKHYEEAILGCLIRNKIDFIALAGYMKLIGDPLLSHYKNKIVNIHPSLLPAFPGLNAIEKAIDYGVKVTGVTIHYVDKGMDTGQIIVQKTIEITDKAILKNEIQKIEHALYKETLEEILREESSDEESVSKCI